MTLDLHNIYDRSEEIERALRPIIKQTVAKKALIDKIIPGKGFGQRPCCAAACDGRGRSRAVDRVLSGPGERGQLPAACTSGRLFGYRVAISHGGLYEHPAAHCPVGGRYNDRL